MPNYYVFYPYEVDGSPSITSEAQLIDLVPDYHEKYLRDRKPKLEKRAEDQGMVAAHMVASVASRQGLQMGVHLFRRGGQLRL